MTSTMKRLGRPIGLALIAALLAGCGLPRTGPNKREIFSGSELRNGNALVIEVDDAVTRATSQIPALSFSDGFLGAGVTGSDTISPRRHAGPYDLGERGRRSSGE